VDLDFQGLDSGTTATELETKYQYESYI